MGDEWWYERGPVGDEWWYERGPVGDEWWYKRGPVGDEWWYERGPVGDEWWYERGPVGDEWWYERGPHGYERGPHGYGDLNDAGRELLSFLATNKATVCNSWFKKRDIQKQTWQHPRKWHCIDYVIMRQTHRRRCLDVSVMQGVSGL